MRRRPSGRNGGFLHGYRASLPRLRLALGDEGALALARAGDRRGDPVVQISPPLVAGRSEFDEIVGVLGDVLAEAWGRTTGSR